MAIRYLITKKVLSIYDSEVCGYVLGIKFGEKMAAKYADEIIGAFNDGEEIDLSDKVSNIEAPRFFHVKELDNNYSNFLENSLGGFASHSEEYDVAVIFDEEKGLYAIPFYETFTKIFEVFLYAVMTSLVAAISGMKLNFKNLFNFCFLLNGQVLKNMLMKMVSE